VIGLVGDLFARSRIALAWWLVGILSMGLYVVLVYDTLGSLEDLRKLYDQYPESIRSLFGEIDIGTINGWIHLELLSWMPLVKSSSQATATIASGLFSTMILRANVPPVATAIFTWATR
jgi:hypothetical protein